MIPSTDDVLRHAGGLYYVSLERVKNIRKRDPFVLMARRAATLALRRRGLSLHQIGKAMGYADHTTAIHNGRIAADLENADPKFAAKVAALVLYATGGSLT